MPTYLVGFAVRNDLPQMVEQEQRRRPVRLGQAIQNAKHEFCIARRVIRHTDGQAIGQHIEEALCEQRLGQLS